MPNAGPGVWSPGGLFPPGSPPSGLLLPHRQSPRGILDDDRRINAQLFEDTFYTRKGKDPDSVPEAKESEKADSSDMETLARLLGDPKTADLLKQLVAAMDK